MSKPKLLKVFDDATSDVAYSKLNNPVTVTQSETTLIVSGVVPEGTPLLTFKSPCDSSAVQSITINNVAYTLVDSNKKAISACGNVFSQNAYVTVLLDPTDKYAYIQNSANNPTIKEIISNLSPTDIGAASNENLLHNWYFGNPVNQRGQTSYTGEGYGIDRWKNAGSDVIVTIKDDGLTVSGYFGQTLGAELSKRLEGQTVTQSLMMTDGTIHALTYVVKKDDENPYIHINDASILYFEYPSKSETGAFRALLHGESIIAAKLELGTKQTLAHLKNGVWVLNEIPDYNEQLLRCCMSTADSSDTYANNKMTANNLNAASLSLGYTIDNTIDLYSLGDGNYTFEGTVPNNKNYPASLVGLYQRISLLVSQTTKSGDNGYNNMILKTAYGQIWYNSRKWDSYTGWKQLATTDYAVNKAGDTLTGHLYVQSGKGGLVAWDNGAAIDSVLSSGKKGRLQVLTGESGASAYIAFNDGSNWVSNYEIIHAGNIGSQSVNYANSAGSAPANGGTAAKLGNGGNVSAPMTFNWSGQSGQPSWVWGGGDGTNMYVYDPSNFSVNYSNTAHGLRTYSEAGTTHSGAWIMNAQYNRAKDSKFRIYCGDGSVGVSVDRADAAANSDTVDGWHVNMDPGSSGLKPIHAGTGDLTAGSSALTTGAIYCVYE